MRQVAGEVVTRGLSAARVGGVGAGPGERLSGSGGSFSEFLDGFLPGVLLQQQGK